MRTIRPVILIYGLVLIISCTGIYAQIISSRIAKNFFSITSYKGTMVEKGLMPENSNSRIVSHIVYKKAWKVRSEVISPSSMKGNLFITDGVSVIMWWPKALFGIRMKGINPPNLDDVKTIIEENVRWSIDHYSFTLTGQEQIAGRSTTKWLAVPKINTLYPYESWMDSENDQPLQLMIKNKNDHAWYFMSYENIQFDIPVDDNEFVFDFPSNAVVFEWDYSDKHMPIQKAKELMNFTIRIPKHLPSGHKILKNIIGKHCLPMMTLIMNKGARWLSLTQNRKGSDDYLKLGIQILLNKHKGVLNFMGPYTVITWAIEETALTLIANMPYSEAISIASSVE